MIDRITLAIQLAPYGGSISFVICEVEIEFSNIYGRMGIRQVSMAPMFKAAYMVQCV